MPADPLAGLAPAGVDARAFCRHADGLRHTPATSFGVDFSSIRTAAVSVHVVSSLRAGRRALRANRPRDARARRMDRADAPGRSISRQAAALLLAGDGVVRGFRLP